MIIPEVCGDEAIYLSQEECDACEAFRQELAELSDLVDQIQAILPTKQDKLIAGDNVQISAQNVISATDTTYSAGTGIAISDQNVISAERNANNTYTKEEVDALLGQLEHARMEEVDTLPATGESNVIYMVPNAQAGGHDLYIWDSINNRWVPAGKDTVDLSGYLKTADLAGVSPIVVNGSTISHANSGVSANTYGPTANVTGSEGATINVPQITVNATGHVTGVTNRTLTNKNTTYGAATTSAAGLMSAADKTKLDGVNSNRVYKGISITSTANTSIAVSNAALTIPVSGLYYVELRVFSWLSQAGAIIHGAVYCSTVADANYATGSAPRAANGLTGFHSSQLLQFNAGTVLTPWVNCTVGGATINGHLQVLRLSA